MSKLGIVLAALALLLVFILCPWRHMNDFAVTAPAANTNSNGNVAMGVPSFKLAFEDGKCRLTGTLPDTASKDQLVAKAAEACGGKGNVIDEMKVGGVSNPAWLACSLFLIQYTKAPVTNVVLSADGGGITLRGEVPKQEDKDRINAEANRGCPANSSITNALNVSGQNALSDEQLQTQTKLNDAIKGKIIEFATGSDQLTDKGKTVLDELIPVLKGSTDDLEIGGHTDNVGDSGRNMSLSQRRAETVKKYLVSKGLEANRFSSKGYGQGKPIADNATEEGRQRNRRIEFQVLGGGK